MPRAIQTLQELPLSHPAFAAPSRKMLLLAGGAIVSVSILTFSYLNQPYVQAVNAPVRGIGGSAASAGLSSSVASGTTSAARAAVQEINVANDGLVYLENVRVDSISGTVLTVGIAWGRAIFPWVIDTQGGKGGTRYIRANGDNTGSINDLHVGDTISITGMLDTTMAQPTIDAQYVRE